MLKSLALVVLAVAATAVLVAPIPLSEPLSWGGDTLEHAALVDSANWLGQPGVSTENGAPHGVDWSWAPSGGERLNLAAIAVLRDATGDLWTALKLHMFIAIAATAVVGFLVLRWLGAMDLIAAGGGLVFALSSPVYDHLEEGHLFLYGLYPIPLAVYLACRWSGWSPGGKADHGPAGPRALVVSAAAVLVIGLSSTYYALFAVLLVAMLSVLVGLRRLDWRSAVPGLLASASVAAVLALSSLPRVLSDNGAIRLDRRLSDSVRFALQPIQLLFPQNESFLGITAGWGSSPSEAIGLLALVGLVALGWVLLRHLGRGRVGVDGLLTRLAALVVLALAIGVPGGLGWLIARLGAQELRAWSRVSTVIGFLGVAALAVLISRWLAAPKPVSVGDPSKADPPVAMPRGLLVGTVLVVLLALLEQRSILPERDGVRELRAEAAAFTAELESALPEGSDVLVWPAGTYLNDFGPGQVLAPSLQGDSLSYSAGSFRGGPGDWQLTWALEEVPDQLLAAAAAGFDAVAIQGDHHLLDDSEALSDEVSAVLGDPEKVSNAGAWEWYSLTGLSERLVGLYGAAAVDAFGESAVRPLGVILEGTPGFPSTGRERDAVVGDNAAIGVRSHDGDSSPVVVGFEVRAAPDATVTVTSGDTTQVVEPGEQYRAVLIELDMDDSGYGEVAITTEGDPLRRAGDDPAAFAELRDIQAFDAALVESPILVPYALR